MTEFVWGTWKTHGRPATGWYAGSARRKANSSPVRVRLSTDGTGMIELTDAATGARVQRIGNASRFWFAPDGDQR